MNFYLTIAALFVSLQTLFTLYILYSIYKDGIGILPNPAKHIFESWRIKHSYYQYLKLLVAALVFVFVLYVAAETQKPIIVGSLLGVLPPALIELNKIWKKPRIEIGEVKITKYPKNWYTFGDWRASEEANNILRVQVRLTNEGRGIAQDCQVHLRSDRMNDQLYHARWSEQKELSQDLSPGESRMVDILWMRLEDTGVYTATPKEDIGDNHHPPGSYEMIHRPELSTGIHSFSVGVNASGMNQRTIDIPQLEEIEIPRDLLEMSEDWEVIQTIKDIGEKYVIYYNINQRQKIEIPKWFELGLLQEIDQFSRENISAKASESYEEALERKFTIERID